MNPEAIKKFRDIIKVAEGANPRALRDINDQLDQVEQHLSEAISALMQVTKMARGVVHGPFEGQIRSYIQPHLQSWIDDKNQPGSLASLRQMVRRSGEDPHAANESVEEKKPEDKAAKEPVKFKKDGTAKDDFRAAGKAWPTRKDDK